MRAPNSAGGFITQQGHNQNGHRRRPGVVRLRCPAGSCPVSGSCHCCLHGGTPAHSNKETEARASPAPRGTHVNGAVLGNAGHPPHAL